MARREAPPDAFGRSAREYEQGRPEWPEELLDRVVSELGLGPQAEVLDLGAGTGKLTRSHVPPFARVVAVDPDDAMRQVLVGSSAAIGKRNWPSSSARYGRAVRS